MFIQVTCKVNYFVIDPLKSFSRVLDFFKESGCLKIIVDCRILSKKRIRDKDEFLF